MSDDKPGQDDDTTAKAADATPGTDDARDAVAGDETEKAVAEAGDDAAETAATEAGDDADETAATEAADDDAAPEPIALAGDAAAGGRTAADDVGFDATAIGATAGAATDTPAGGRRWRLWLGSVAALAIAVALAWFLWLQPALQPDSDNDAERTPVAATPAQSQPAPRRPEPAADRLGPLQEQLGGLQSQVDRLSSELGALRADVEAQENQADALSASISQRADLLESLPGRVRNTEDALATLQGISSGSRNAWLLAEAEYYLQIANAQMQLANNPALAAAALELADQRVRELGDPTYTPVRRAIAEELAALNAISRVDTEGITLTLGSLASMVPGLPLARGVVEPSDENTVDVPEDLSGWERVKRTSSEFFSSMVTIREAGEQVRPMLSPEAEYFLRQNLQLQLQAARLSLLLGETANYQQSLQDAERWLRDYFDTSSTAVQAAIAMLEDADDTTLVTERPDISGSLKLLRQQRELEAIAE